VIERLFGRRGRGAEGLSVRPSADTSWRFDEPPWDRPADEEFAPPPEQGLHWAFRTPAQESSTAPVEAGDVFERIAAPGDWRRPLSDAAESAWLPEDGMRLVTAGAVEPDARTRDPAQPGMFDDEPWWGPTAPQERSWTEHERTMHAIPIHPPDPPAAVPAAAEKESVFGEYFGRRWTGPPTAAQSAGPTAGRAPDPRDWPPIPTGVLPSAPRSLAAMPAADPDGRRFSWPPPQPRLATPPADERPAQAPADAAGQETLWRRDPLGRTGKARPGV
jgi:hypothetical protein